MHKAMPFAMAAALLLGASSLAIAQTTTTKPSTGTSGSMSSGKSMSGSMTESQVKEKLAADGYTNVRDLHKDKNGWTAKAMHNGKEASVMVDESGKVETR